MIILDTNVISEFSRPSPNMAVVNWIVASTPSDLYITAITEAELRYGIRILPHGRRRDLAQTRVEQTLGRYFAGRVLPFDSHAARSYARIAASRRTAGHPIGHADCQIAAIAHSVGAALATSNLRDFRECGVEVINPWSRR